MSLAVMEAKEFRSRLGSDFPRCYKMMLKSHVNSGLLALPTDFCESHIPKKIPNDLPTDYVHFVLEDEKEKQWEVRYFPCKFWISAGWKIFVSEHDLVVGDVLIFQLVGPRKFKVYIIKANKWNEVDGSLRLMNVKLQTKQMGLKQLHRLHGQRDVTYIVSLMLSQRSPEQLSVIAREDSCSLSDYSFQEVKTFKDFHIVVNGLCVDHEFPDDIRSVYYRLCFQEKEFLHNGISEHHYSMFVVGMIGETVNISIKIKNYSFITTTQEELDRWENILEAFELLGMKVQILRDRIRTIRTYMFNSEAAVVIRNYKEAANQLKLIKDEIPRVDAKIRELKQIATKCEENLCSFKQRAEISKNMFQELVDAP